VNALLVAQLGLREFSCRAAQLTFTKLREVRSELWWIAPAIGSLPVPVSPDQAGGVALATFFTTSRTMQTSLDPMI
jgi:hypothetical protein